MYVMYIERQSSQCALMLHLGSLGSVMIGVIVFSRRCGINPDNVATPIAASLGDLTTLALLSFISNVMYKTLGK